MTGARDHKERKGVTRTTGATRAMREERKGVARTAGAIGVVGETKAIVMTVATGVTGMTEQE